VSYFTPDDSSDSHRIGVTHSRIGEGYRARNGVRDTVGIKSGMHRGHLTFWGRKCKNDWPQNSSGRFGWCLEAAEALC
jgi:hypothetical protein